MEVLVKKMHPLAKMPVKLKDQKDFCYDVYATSREEIAPNVFKYGIGLGFQIVRDEEIADDDDIILSIDCRPRSSIYKTGLILSNCEGTVDENYINEVSLVFYRVIPGMKIYDVGDRIGQIKIGITVPMEFKLVDNLELKGRGMDGYGSTGRK